MKLFILRHGEAEAGGRGPDFDRRLTNRGKDTVIQVGKKLNDQGATFDKVVCSTAKRTRETVDLVLKQFGMPAEVTFSEVLYEASLPQVLELIMGLKSSHQQVLLIGHNPSFSELGTYLLGVNFVSLAPGHLMSFELAIDVWEELNRGCGTIIEG